MTLNIFPNPEKGKKTVTNFPNKRRKKRSEPAYIPIFVPYITTKIVKSEPEFEISKNCWLTNYVFFYKLFKLLKMFANIRQNLRPSRYNERRRSS